MSSRLPVDTYSRYTIVSAGQVHRGWIGIELPAGSRGGTLTYGQLVVPTASWTVQR